MRARAVTTDGVGRVVRGAVLAAVLVPAVLQASESKNDETPAATTLPPVDVRVDDDGLTVRAQGVALSDVARALERASVATVIIADVPGLERTPISADVRALPLAKALREILYGLSYTSERDPESGLVRVRVTASNTGSALEPAAVTAGKPAVEARRANRPRDLDEFRSLEALEAALARAEVEGLEEDAISRELYEEDAALAREALELARVERALDVLEEAEDESLRISAVDALVGRRDVRATRALVRVAEEAPSTEARRHAVESLVNHAANLEFEDPATVAALERLAQAEDEEIQGTAARALEGMQRFLERRRRSE